ARARIASVRSPDEARTPHPRPSRCCAAPPAGSHAPHPSARTISPAQRLPASGAPPPPGSKRTRDAAAHTPLSPLTPASPDYTREWSPASGTASPAPPRRPPRPAPANIRATAPDSPAPAAPHTPLRQPPDSSHPERLRDARKTPAEAQTTDDSSSL